MTGGSASRGRPFRESKLGLRLIEATKALRKAERKVRILRSIAWPASVRERFFEKKERELPEVRYAKKDLSEVFEGIHHVRTLLCGRTKQESWLRRQARTIETAAKMLRAVGTRDFHRYSVRLYGSPEEPSLDGSTSLDLARRLEAILAGVEPDDLGDPPQPVTGQELASRLEEQTIAAFGEHAPKVMMVKTLSAKVTAGSRRIRVREDAPFTEADVHQLMAHEAMVHVATSINGKQQQTLPILAASHAGTTRTQEGRAVFSELITGVMDPLRFRRLAHRTIAIQMAIDGASFLDLYRFFREKGGGPEQSFEDARRVVRGGRVEGGAPFTKDGVYLDGLLRIHGFLHALIELHRAELLPLLFAGKLDVEDFPVLARLQADGMIKGPLFMPRWAEDRAFLIAHISYTSFLSRSQIAPCKEHFRKALEGL